MVEEERIINGMSDNRSIFNSYDDTCESDRTFGCLIIGLFVSLVAALLLLVGFVVVDVRQEREISELTRKVEALDAAWYQVVP